MEEGSGYEEHGKKREQQFKDQELKAMPNDGNQTRSSKFSSESEPTPAEIDVKDNCNETAEIEELIEEIQELQQEPTDSLQDDLIQHHNIFITDSDRNRTVKHSVIIICDFSKFTTPAGLVKIIILISCIVSLTCVCITDYPALVLSGYIRFHIFSLTFTFLCILVIFLVEILTLLLLFPVHWPHFNALVHFGACLLLNASSSLLIHALFTNESSMPRLDTTVEMVIVSGVSGYFGALLCMLMSVIACCCYDHHLTLPWKQHPEGVLMLK